ncbi:MAG TPA: imidazole glycerol phosphate synthase subunit HisH [Halanaerobiales bacterium]|nr:imidazole glycerol phosphate synthase subunit HisH [Halanaerobiales bacterium]
MVGIIDYGAGNLNSICKAFEHIGFTTEIIEEKIDTDKYEAVVLPGVGAFPGAMDRLRANNLVEFIKEFVKTNKPMLGVCLGMQLLFEWGYEDTKTKGLDLLPGEVVKMESSLKIPHMGWNELEIIKEDPLFKGLPDNPHYYFVHSYKLKEITEEVIAVTEYGGKVPAVVKKDNIIGLQFHPEKSGNNGLKLLENFGELI